MTQRSYEHYSGLAIALDAVGERWALLIIRDLLAGPKRFKDLERSLVGINPTLLSKRLKELAGQSIIQRSQLPPPADVPVYELTPGNGRCYCGQPRR